MQLSIQGCEIRQEPDGKIEYVADADIDADGCNGQSGVWAYKDGDNGLEALTNAGYPKHPQWYRRILLCDGTGKPIIFEDGGIASKTAYEYRDKKPRDPSRWVDSNAVPYVVVPPELRRKAKGIVLGCACRVTNMLTHQSVDGVVADIGPATKIGEISMAAARAIGIDDDPRIGGTSGRHVRYEIFTNRAAIINGIKYNLIPA